MRQRDVMPSAAHITSATLSGVQPDVIFNKSRIYTMPYGRQSDDTVSIGSLELLQSSQLLALFNTNDPAFRTGSVGEETAAQIKVDIPDGTFDIVIMNPPFTRNTGMEAEKVGVFNPAFAAFNASDADQQAMGKRLTTLKKGTCYHGNAGIASAFAALGHNKLKSSGVLALVLPLSAASGLAWQSFREMLVNHYTDLTVLSLADADNDDLSFSADTGMAECLVIARKLIRTETATRRADFVSLNNRAQGFADAAAIAKGVLETSHERGIEDGPYGGVNLSIGDEAAGEALTAGLIGGETWNCVRLLDYALAQTAHTLSQSKLWLPGSPSGVELPVVPLAATGKLGFYHLDINGPPPHRGAPPRGPFTNGLPSPTSTYPCLWNHDAKKEILMVCEPDSQLTVRSSMETKAATVWATASRSHVNRDFRFNSQPLSAAFTERECVGGHAWPNVIFEDKRFDFPFTVWGNCTLGLFMYWWHSNRQQSGRGRTTIRAAESLSVLDFRALSDDQLATAEDIFNDFRNRELKPAYLADADPNRALLDRRVVCDLLGLDESVYEGVRRLAAKWCAEPSVHGGKARPRSGPQGGTVPRPCRPDLGVEVNDAGGFSRGNVEASAKLPSGPKHLPFRGRFWAD